MRFDEFLYLLHNWFSDPTGAETPWKSGLTMEFLFWAAVIVLALLLLRWRPGFLAGLESGFKTFARRKMLAVVSVGVLALAARLALLPFVEAPEPIVHDEYSYILQAQTMASGRITNPTPPLWVHFETFHVNMQPTYQSMYPPAHALFLTLGQLLLGKPWWGVWLSVGIMCACVTWMLQGWMPAHWALLGGLFCVLRFATFSYWLNSYFGGSVAAIGGALLFGAVARLMRKPSAGMAVVLALGLLILANSRPYEGLVCAVPAMLWLLLWTVRKRMWNLHFVKQVLAPTALVLGLGAAGMLYYNWRGTGNPLLMPYVLNQNTYHISKPFLWQSANPIPHYNHFVMRTFYCFHELPDYFRSRHLWGLQLMTEMKFRVYYEFFLWPMLLVALPAALRMMRSRRLRILPITALAVLLGLLAESWMPQGHYAAPVLCVVVAIVLYGLRMARTWTPRQFPAGAMLVRAAIVVVAGWSFFPLGAKVLDPYELTYVRAQMPPELDRARIQAQLESMPGEHLVLIHTRRSYTGYLDWVYNEPDINHAKVVWARDMGTEGNKELVDYFPHRQVWIVDQNDGIMRLTAYNGHSSEDTLASAVGLPSPKAQN